MQTEPTRKIVDRIEAHSRILITRHAHADGDAVGAAFGLRQILRLSYPEKEILSVNADFPDSLAFLGEDDAPVTKEKYADALAIVLDTGNPDRVSDRNFSLAGETVLIDHHVAEDPFCGLSWIEVGCSSVCEMIAFLYLQNTDRLQIDKEAATCLYAGMVTDTGRFRFSSTNGDTLRIAAFLLDRKIETEPLFARLTLENFDYFKFQAEVLTKMKLSENGVASIRVTKGMQEKYALNHEQSGNAVNFLSEIKGSLIWIAFIDNEDGTFRVRLRSRFVFVHELAEKYGGGGHACACGATVRSRKEMNALLSDADSLLADYKAHHTGWM